MLWLQAIPIDRGEAEARAMAFLVAPAFYRNVMKVDWGKSAALSFQWNALPNHRLDEAYNSILGYELRM